MYSSQQSVLASDSSFSIPKLTGVRKSLSRCAVDYTQKLFMSGLKIELEKIKAAEGKQLIKNCQMWGGGEEITQVVWIKITSREGQWKRSC